MLSLPVIVSRKLYTELRNTAAYSEDNKDNKQFNPEVLKNSGCVMKRVTLSFFSSMSVLRSDLRSNPARSKR